VHDLTVLLYFVIDKEFIAFYLGRCEDDRLSLTAINGQNVSQGLHSIVVWAIYRNVFNIPLSFSLQILRQIDALPARVKVSFGHLLNPRWSCCGKKHELRRLLALIFDFI